MTSYPGSPRLRIPLVKRIEFSSFSLYEQRPNLALDVDIPVFCLAGANGLGKSTFLSALGFGITGIVPDPNQKFASLKEYYTDNLAFSQDYFTGRIEPADRSEAEVSVTFSLGESVYSVTRGLFEPTQLRGLSIRGSGADEEVDRADSDADKSALHERYVARMVEDSGFASFEQIVFIHYFLLTFDERRHLLFWDPEVARQALYLAFGVDADEAVEADELQRQADRLESQARQAQYQATTALQRIQELKRRVDGLEPIDDSLIAEHDLLIAANDQAKINLSEASRASEDARLQYQLAAARHHSLLRDYQVQFAEGLRVAKPRASEHPIVLMLLREHKCSVCGSEGEEVAGNARQDLASLRCPLCSSRLIGDESAPRAQESFRTLEQLDQEIQTAHTKLGVAAEEAARTATIAETAEQEYNRVLRDLSSFEASHEELGVATSNDSLTLGPIIAQLEIERTSAQERRNRYRARRDELRRRLAPIQDRAASQYIYAEPAFVPRFQELAHDFLGLDLQVAMEKRARGAELLLTINGTRRRRTTQLSESQRYFVDIALRMALAEYMVGEENQACIFVDTPEGSLDISYEVRAGKMFANFVKVHNRILMTANINSSKLVQRLAEECGRGLMHIERMTDWASLSEVQAEAEGLFDVAYEEFEAALDGEMV